MKKSLQTLLLIAIFLASYLIYSQFNTKSKPHLAKEQEHDFSVENSKYGTYLIAHYFLAKEQHENALKYLSLSYELSNENSKIAELKLFYDFLNGNFEQALKMTQKMEKSDKFYLAIIQAVKLLKDGKILPPKLIENSGTPNDEIFKVAQIWLLAFQNPNKAIEELNIAISKNNNHEFTYEFAQIANFLSSKNQEMSEKAALLHKKLLYNLTASTSDFEFFSLDEYAKIYGFFKTQKNQKIAETLHNSFNDLSIGSAYYENPLNEIVNNFKPLTSSNQAIGNYFAFLAKQFLQFNIDQFAIIYSNLSLYLDPTNDMAKFITGQYHAKKNSFNKAIEQIELIQDIRIKEHLAVKISESLSKKEKFKEAINLLEKFQNSNFSLIDEAIAENHFRIGQEEKAIEIFQKIIKKNKNKKNAWKYYYMIGSINSILEDFTQAEKNLKLALEQMPKHPIILNDLAYVYALQNKKPKQALEFAKKALQSRPNDPSFLDTMGWVLFHQKKYDKSTIYLEKAMNLKPDNVEIMEHLAKAYIKQERFLEAQTLISRALSFLKDENTQIDSRRDKMLENFTKLQQELQTIN